MNKQIQFVKSECMGRIKSCIHKINRIAYDLLEAFSNQFMVNFPNKLSIQRLNGYLCIL